MDYFFKKDPLENELIDWFTCELSQCDEIAAIYVACANLNQKLIDHRFPPIEITFKHPCPGVIYYVCNDTTEDFVNVVDGNILLDMKNSLLALAKKEIKKRFR